MHTAVALTPLAFAACVGVEEPELGTVESMVSVSTYTTSGCSTSVVLGLSTQIADEVGCMAPGALVRFNSTANLQFSSSAVLPYLHEGAKADLEKVAATRTVILNSTFRTVVQQYLLYRWFQDGRCGITAAAQPGRSNHESGRAIDVQNYSSLISAMSARGWAHDVPGDPVHFDHTASPDIRNRDVKAFQRLWNRNNPSDPIAEDGAYGPQTQARLNKSPATGFPIGASCTNTVQEGGRVVSVDGPDRLAPGARGHFKFTIANNSTTDWPASTKVLVADGTPSPLADGSWVSPTEVGTMESLGGADITAGAMGVVELDVTAPMVGEETAENTELELTADDGTPVGHIQLAVTVTPNSDQQGTSGDSDDAHDDGIELVGGCAASRGGSGWLVLAGIALVALRRRRPGR